MTLNIKKLTKIIIEWLVYIILFIAIVWGTPKLLVKIFNTDYPIASITSGSMWPALKEGDIVFIKGLEDKKAVAKGDVVVYRNERGFTIHRITELREDTLVTKGDANNVSDSPIKYEQLTGKMITYGDSKPLRIPYLGKLSQIFGKQ